MEDNSQGDTRAANGGGANEQTSATNGANGATLSAAAAASAQQPKVVQTAFIHKLYKYVEKPRKLLSQLPRERESLTLRTVCSKIKAYGTSYPGRTPTRAS